MPDGIWLDDQSYNQTGGVLWAQQQWQGLGQQWQNGQDWVNQQLQNLTSTLTSPPPTEAATSSSAASGPAPEPEPPSPAPLPEQQPAATAQDLGQQWADDKLSTPPDLSPPPAQAPSSAPAPAPAATAQDLGQQWADSKLGPPPSLTPSSPVTAPLVTDESTQPAQVTQPAQPDQQTTQPGRVFPVQGFTGQVQDHWGSVTGGSDLFAPRGTPVLVMEPGKVLESGYNAIGGNSLLVQGNDGLQYYYAHFDQPSDLKVGQQVQAGQYVAPVGNTGDAKNTGTHLHIGIGPDIKLGSDKYGGTGGDYDAVGLLQQTLTGQPASVPVVAGQNQSPTAPVTAPLQAPSNMQQAQGKDAFIKSLAPLAAASSQQTGIDPSVYLAIAANETGWGQSQTAQKQNNLFSIQGTGANGQRWAGYDTPQASFDAFNQLISTAPRYAQAWADRADPLQFINDLRHAGYVADEPGFPAQGWVDQVSSIWRDIQSNVQQVLSNPGAAINLATNVLNPGYAGAQIGQNVQQQGLSGLSGQSVLDAFTQNGPIPTQPQMDMAQQISQNLLQQGQNLATGLGTFGSTALDTLNQQQQQPFQDILNAPQTYQNLVQSMSRGDVTGALTGIAQLGSLALNAVPMLSSAADLSPAVSAGLESAGVPKPVSQILGQVANVAAMAGVENGVQFGARALEQAAPDIARFLGSESGELDLSSLLRSRQPAQAETGFATGLWGPQQPGESTIYGPAGEVLSQVTPQAAELPAELDPQQLVQRAVNINLAKYPEAAQQPIASMAEALPETLAAARRGVIPDQTIPGMAQGVDVQQIIANHQAGQAYNAETLYALGDALSAQSQRVVDAQDLLRQNPDDLTTRANFMAELLQQGAIQEALTGGTAEAGRALRVLRQPLEGSAFALQQMATMARNSGMSQEDLINHLARLDLADPDQLSQLAQLAAPVSLPPNEALPTGEMPGQLSLFEPDRPVQGYMQPSGTPAGTGLMGQLGEDIDASMARYQQGVAERAARMQQYFQDAHYQAMPGEEVQPPGRIPVADHGVAPPPPPGSPPGSRWYQGELPEGGGNVVSGAQRADQFVKFNAVSGFGAIGRSAISGVLMPAWRFGTGEMQDLLLNRSLSRAQGRAIGYFAGMAETGSSLLKGLLDVYNDPAKIAARAGSPADRIYGLITQTPLAIHSAFQQMGTPAIALQELYATATAQAAAEGYRGDELAARAAELVKNPPPGWQDTANGIARRFMGRELGTMGQKFETLLKGLGPVGDFIAPVFRLPYALTSLKTTISPLGALGTGWDVARGLTGMAGGGPYVLRDAEGNLQRLARPGDILPALAPGWFSQDAAASALNPFTHPSSKAVFNLQDRAVMNLIGTAATASFVSQALQGNVSGAGPDDPDARRQLMASGWRPYSVRLGGQWYSQELFAPVAMDLALAGEYADAVNYPKDAQESLDVAAGRRAGVPSSMQAAGASPTAADAAAQRLFSHLGSHLVDMAGLSGLTDVLDMLQNGSDLSPSAAGARFAGEFGSLAVPASGLLRSVADVTDPYARQIQTGPYVSPQAAAGQALQEGIPGLRGNLPPQLTPLGAPVMNAGQGVGALIPGGIGRASSDVASEVAMLNVGRFVPPAPETVPYGQGREVVLMPDEKRAYTQAEGSIYQQIIQPMIDSGSWMRMSGNDQRFLLNQIAPMARQYADAQMLGVIPGDQAMGRSQPTARNYLSPAISYAPESTATDYLGQQVLAQREANHRALMQALFAA